MIGMQKSIDVNIQSQTSPLFGYYLMTFDKEDITLQAGLSEDATTCTLSSGHGFTGASGEQILIYENNHFLQQNVLAANINGDVITFLTPVDIAFTTAAKVIRGNKYFNKDFSGVNAKNVLFSVLDGTIPVDISSAILTMNSSGVPDDGKFGGITELTNGIYFRQLNQRRVNLGNYRNNQNFKDRGGVVEYTDKAPASEYSTTIKFDFENVFGQVLRISPNFNCSFLVHLRENFSTLSRFTISLIGSYTQGEL